MNVHNMTQYQHVYSTYSTVPIPSYLNNEAMFNEKNKPLKKWSAGRSGTRCIEGAICPFDNGN